MKRIPLAVIALSALLGSSAQAADPVAPSSVAQATKRTIQIGGDLKQWDSLPKYTIIQSNGVPSVPVKFSAYYSLAYDDQNLYILGVFDQDKDTVRAKLKSDAPEWWNDDVMEVFFRTDPFAKAPTGLHMAANPAGERFKAYTFTTDYQTVGRIEDKRWVLEIALPLNKGALPAVKDGDIWGLKVGREHQQAAEFPLWPIGGDFNAPGNYGYMVFSAQPVDTAKLAQEITAKLGASPATAPIASRLSDIGSYTVYYGKEAQQVEQLINFDLAIVQPTTLTSEQLKTLHENGTRAVAYLSIGEADPTNPYTKDIPAAWALGTNPNWGSKFINASEPGWQELVMKQADDIMKQGFDGFFLDTLDTVDLYPQAKAGLIKIVEQLRAKYPDAVIVQNRGFALLNDTGPLTDAVMFESFSTAYDFKNKTYNAFNGDPSYVQALAKRGLVVLALDYADPAQQALVTGSYERAKSFGFIPYVSTINLDQVYNPNP